MTSDHTDTIATLLFGPIQRVVGPGNKHFRIFVGRPDFANPEAGRYVDFLGAI